MEKQKFVQKEWYEHKPPVEGNEVIQISTLTHIQRLKNLFPAQKARLSLNCGCGSGWQKDLFGPSIGMDISYENIHSFVKAGGQGIVADMEFLPFRDQTFDIVYGFGILHHLNDIRKGVSEAVRVLKKGGHIGFGGENNGLCPFNYIMPFVYGNWRIEKGFYRIRENLLNKLFRELGIKKIRVSSEGMTVYGMNRMIYRFTQTMEVCLSRFSILKRFSGYLYIAGTKVVSQANGK
jgi:SAM-dependent methyltransferase